MSVQDGMGEGGQAVSEDFSSSVKSFSANCTFSNRHNLCATSAKAHHAFICGSKIKFLFFLKSTSA